MSQHAEFLKHLLRHQAGIQLFVRALVRDPQEREDVLQDVVVILWEKFDQYDRSRPFDAWARGIAANKVLQRHERRGRVPTPFPPEAVAALLDAFDRQSDRDSQQADALEECLRALPERSRRMLQLRYHDSLDVPEIASQVNSTAAAVYKSLARIRTGLRECIERRTSTAREAS